MAATNYTPIQLYFSTTASAAPTAANLAQGELAINITDGKLYYEDGSGVVQVIATKGAGTIGGSTTQIQYNNSGALAGSAAMVFNNSTNVTTLTTLNLTNALGAIYGGTAQSTYTQGDFLYASAANTLSKLGIGANTYILTSTGSIPQWVAPSSIAVLTATNLAGGLAGSVPYQSALDTTTFLAIGAANRVMTSTGTAPQWVTSLTGLTGVSSSSITNTSLTSGRVVVSTTAGLQADDADLTFDGTTLSAGGFSTVGLSTLVKTVKIGDSSFNGVAVFAAATPAKLYMGTGTVTDVTSAISATNAIGAIASLGITPIAATNTSVTYTNAATLYIAGAPSAGTNVTLTNPYSLYVAAGAAYFGGAVTVAGSLSLAAVTVTSLTDSGLTSGRVTYAGTGGLLQDSANLTFSGSALAVTGTFSSTGGATIQGLTVGLGSGGVGTNTVLGVTALSVNASGQANTALGYQALKINTASDNTAIGSNTLEVNVGGLSNVAIGSLAMIGNVSGSNNVAVGAGVAGTLQGALGLNTSGSNNTAIGYASLRGNLTASNNTAVGYRAAYTNATGTSNVAVGPEALFQNVGGSYNTAVGAGVVGTIAAALGNNSAGTYNTGIGNGALSENINASFNTAVGAGALQKNTSAASNTAVGYQSLYSYTNGGGGTVAVGYQAGYTTNAAYGTFVGQTAGFSSTGANNTHIGFQAGYYTTTGTNNVSLGWAALEGASGGVSTGGSNVAIGSQALRANTTAAANTAVGFQAGGANETGQFNVYLGLSAGFGSTSGERNVWIGYSAGPNAGSSAANTGSYNTAVGMNAMTKSTTGNYNSAFGYEALQANTTASNNTAVGYQAGYNTDGTANTFVGHEAGKGVTSGTYNICLGKSAGNGATPITTGTQNIIIGYFTSVSAGSDGSEIVIGASGSGTVGKGSNTGFINPDTGGVYQGNNSLSWSITSDQRIKKNIVDNNTGLSVINQIQVRNFEYRLPEEITELPQGQAVAKTGVQLGVIAQELQQILPECVKTESTGVMSVNADNLTWYLVNAIKELKAEIDSLKSQLNGA